MNTCSLFYWQKLDQAPCTRQSTDLSHCSKQPQTWLEQCLHRHCQTCLLSLEIYLLSTIYYLLSTIYSIYLLSTLSIYYLLYLCIWYLPMVLYWSCLRRWWVPGSQDSASLHWSPGLVTMGHMCHGLGVPMSVVTLAVVSAPGGGQEATGGGPGRDHGDTGHCSAVLWHHAAYTALALSTLHYWYTLHYGASTLNWLEVALSNKPHSVCVGIIGLYVSMTVKVWDPQSAASADKPLSCTNVDTVELCNTMHRPVSCILEYFQLNAVVSARLCSVKICYKGFSTFEFRPPPTSSRHSRARSAISYNIANLSGLKIVTFLNLLCFNFSLSTFDGVLN